MYGNPMQKVEHYFEKVFFKKQLHSKKPCLYARFLETDAILLYSFGDTPCLEKEYTNRTTSSRKEKIRPSSFRK